VAFAVATAFTFVALAVATALALVAFSVAATFALVALAVMAAAFALAVFLVAMALALVAAALLRRKIFTVKAFLELLLGGLADSLYATAEIESLAGHGVIEVHHHVVFLNLGYGTLNHLALAVDHREDTAGNEELGHKLAVHLEGLYRELYEMCGIV